MEEQAGLGDLSESATLNIDRITDALALVAD
jgi:hypothetical protein